MHFFTDWEILTLFGALMLLLGHGTTSNLRFLELEIFSSARRGRFSTFLLDGGVWRALFKVSLFSSDII